MIQTTEWKYVLYDKFPPQLFDLKNDPHEFFDLGTDSQYHNVRKEFYDRLFTWLRGLKVRTEVSSDEVYKFNPESTEQLGIMIGHW
tara:strand:- start:301 stop:558 length:258 start_codon:yes stop_codon:yes gene_type:complete